MVSNAELFNNLSKLKESIQSGDIPDKLMVFEWEDTPFIAFQYIHEIVNQKHLQLRTIDDFDNEFKGIHESMIEYSDDYFNLLITDEFKSDLIDELPFIKNTAVVAKKVEEGTKFSVTIIGSYYDIPKLKSWQIKKYIESRCKGLSPDRVDWLNEVTASNVDRIDSELDKISCFPLEEQDKIFDQLEQSGNFSDLKQRKIFDLTNPIVSRKTYKLVEVIKDIDNMDVSEYSLVAQLKSSFELLMKVQMNPSLTANDLDIKENRLAIIKRDVGKFTNKRLTEIYKFLSDFDYNLKSGNLDIKPERLIDYIICTILS